MFFKILFNYILGYKTVEIEGYYIERFLNNTLKNNLFLWNLNRKTNTILQVNIGNNDYLDLVSLANKNQCLIKIKKEWGIPYLFNKYKNRKYLLISIFIFVIFVFSISRFIWNIEIVGNENIKSDEIISLLNDGGLKIGKYKEKIDYDGIIEKIRIARDDISWIGIEVKGTNAIVRVVENIKGSDIVDDNDFCNIVAKKDGVITKIYAQNGTCVKKDGDEVKKGDVLIAGWMEGLYTGRYFVNGRGSCMAKVRYSQTEKVYKQEIQRNHTERSESKFSIKFNNFQINFFKRLSKFKKYDTIEAIKNVQIFRNFYLPIQIITYKNYEVMENTVNHDYEEAKSIGDKMAVEKMEKLIEGEIIEKNVEIIEKDDCYEVTVYYDVNEEIGTKEKI